MRYPYVAFGFLLAVMASPTQADMIAPSHYCSKPYKPYQFNSEIDIQNFQYEVTRFKNCINEFVEEQDDAIRNHQRAAQEAIEEWNSFVRYELQ